jgi:hypothetical protein
MPKLLITTYKQTNSFTVLRVVVVYKYLGPYRVSQEEGSIYWEVIASVILNKKVYMYVSYSERFPRYSYFTVQYTVHCTDEQHAMSSHELQSALMWTVEFSKVYCTR